MISAQWLQRSALASLIVAPVLFRFYWAAKMARTSSITMPSMVGIVRRTPTVDKKV